MFGSRLSILRSAGIILLTAAPGVTAETRIGLELVEELSRIGPRGQGGSGRQDGQRLLLQAMEVAGLEGVQRMPRVDSEGSEHLAGSLPGGSGIRVVLTAHYDTVDDSPGVLDNASGCAAILETTSELSRVSRQHEVRVVLTDGEEAQASGSRAWLRELTLERRREMLANLNVDIVGSPDAADLGIVHILAGWNGDRRLVSPAWLVHAVLRGAETTGIDISVLDSRWSWLAQLGVRCALPTRVSDGNRFLESGIPSVTVSDLPLTAAQGYHAKLDREEVDFERLDQWVRGLTATTRRLDVLEDRPAWETEYLVVAGRVWVRRDLMWPGFLLWILLVWRGLPGAWRQRGSAARRRMGRDYLPGFAFRMLFLAAVFLTPTFATILLYPLGLLALIGKVQRTSSQLILCTLGALPTLVFSAWLATVQFSGWLILDRGALLPAAVTLLTLATFCAWQMDSRVEPVSSGQ